MVVVVAVVGGSVSFNFKEPVITLSSGEAKQIEILYIEPIDGYRIQFDWYKRGSHRPTA